MQLLPGGADDLGGLGCWAFDEEKQDLDCLLLKGSALALPEPSSSEAGQVPLPVDGSARTGSAEAAGSEAPGAQGSSMVLDGGGGDAMTGSAYWGSQSHLGAASARGGSQAGSQSRGHKRGPRPRLFKKNCCQADGCPTDLQTLSFYYQRCGGWKGAWTPGEGMPGR